LKTVPTGSNKEIFERIYHLEFLGSFYKIIQFNLVHPASIAPVERGFYFMNLIESKWSCMKDDLLDVSLFIKLNGLPLKSLIYESQIFKETKDILRDKRKEITYRFSFIIRTHLCLKMIKNNYINFDKCNMSKIVNSIQYKCKNYFRHFSNLDGHFPILSRQPQFFLLVKLYFHYFLLFLS